MTIKELIDHLNHLCEDNSVEIYFVGDYGTEWVELTKNNVVYQKSSDRIEIC